MYLFPIVGITIGLIVGSIGFGLSLFLDPLIVSLLVVVSLAILTGIHHTDGLADFADGLMAKGAKEKKLAAMKDLSTGSAGIVTIVLYVVGLIIAISLSTGYQLFLAILLSEIFAKFSMVLMASIGKSASLGSNSPFVELMKNKKKLMLATVITLIPLIVLGGSTGLLLFGIGVTFTLFLTILTTRSFGGITGDVLGATNELTRLVSLLIFVSI
jgi:adenosylcobinamide-GDP ribazoletransferase